MPLKEKWYNVDYSIEKFSESLLDKIKNPLVVDNGKKLDLPPMNSLIPQNFDILEIDESLSEKPILIHQIEADTDLWYKKDDKFKTPKGIVTCKIYTGDLYFG